MQKSKRKPRKYRGVSYPENWQDIGMEAKEVWRQAIDQLKGPPTEYMRNITPCYNEHGKAAFEKTVYK